MHSTYNIEDGYLGSGKRINNSINKYGKENFTKEILEYLSTRKLLSKKEAQIVNDDLLKNPLCLNLKKGGTGGGKLWNEEHAKKFHAAGGKKVFQILGQKHVEKLKFNPDYKEKWIKSLIDCDNPGFSGKKHSKETRKKMSNADRTGKKNSQFGTCWITNEKENKKIHKGAILPKGFRLGRKIS